MSNKKIYSRYNRVMLFFVAVLLFTTLLEGCATSKTDNKAMKEPDSTTAITVEKEKEKTGTRQIVMEFGNTVVEAELDDSSTSQEFLKRLPMTLPMKRSDDREYYVHIDPLPETGRAIPDYENGDVTYYTKGPSLAIFFDKASISSQANLIRMGKITSGLSLLEELGEEAQVTIHLKK